MPKLKHRVELDIEKVVAMYNECGGVVPTAKHFRRRTSIISNILTMAGISIGTFNDISGKRYGSLTVIKRVDHSVKQANKPYWICECDCGKMVTVKGSNLQSGGTKSCGCNRHPKGKISHAWKGGITPANCEIRNSTEYNDWRNSVFRRDDYTCSVCTSRGHTLAAHHIANFADNPSMRFDIGNGITMCKDCHDAFHIIFGKRNNNEEQLHTFIARKCIVIEENSNGIINGTFK